MVEIASKLPVYNELTYHSDQKSEVMSFLIHLVPYLKNESCKLEPPSYNNIADIAYSVSAASDDLAFCSLFTHFGTKENVYTEYTIFKPNRTGTLNKNVLFNF